MYIVCSEYVNHFSVHVYICEQNRNENVKNIKIIIMKVGGA